jgi:hypothetical protein
MRAHMANPVVANCTFFGNGNRGITTFASSLTVVNSILWGNEGGQITSGSASVAFSNIQGGWSGAGSDNIDTDPLFVDSDNGDYRLLARSRCIDVGDNTAVPESVLRDLDGNPRFVADACAGESGATVDMGAYEFQGTSCNLSNMLALLAAWGACNDCGNCPSDFNGDCSAGMLDLMILLGNWTA